MVLWCVNASINLHIQKAVNFLADVESSHNGQPSISHGNFKQRKQKTIEMTHIEEQ